MRAQMDDELARLDESLAADIAFMRSLARMNTHVSVQFATVLERTTANVALVWPLFRMNSTKHREKRNCYSTRFSTNIT
jgi:hypothetical protein